MCSDASTRSIAVAGHVCLDLTPAFPQLASSALEILSPGALRIVGPATLSPGGAVSNTGLALHRLGVPVRLIARIGRDLFGDALVSLYSAFGAPTEDLLRIDGEATSYSVVIDPPGRDRSFLHCPGANDRYNPAAMLPPKLLDCALLHFGYPQAIYATYADGGRALARAFQSAQNAGIATSLDTCFADPDAPAGKTDWPAFLRRVLPHVDFFCPSWDELWMMYERRPLIDARSDDAPFSSNWLRDLSRRLHDFGSPVVLIKLGPDGLFLSATRDQAPLLRLEATIGLRPSEWRGRVLHAPCFHVEPASTTGAGDVTVAGFLAALRDGLDPPASLRFATAVGAHRVESRLGVAGIPPAHEVWRRVHAGWCSRTPSRPFANWRRCDSNPVWEAPTNP